MIRRLFVWLPPLLAAALLSACASPRQAAPAGEAVPASAGGGDSPAAADPAQAPVAGEPEAVQPTLPPTESAEQPTAPPAEAAPEVDYVSHRAAPAPPDTFVADSAQFVAATGRPQLIEFFTYW
ncbi:MAG: hypothetical protein Kow00124_19490 [Anaerolineae bacterium]